MPGQDAPESVVLKIALKEVAGLVRQLGNAPPLVQDAFGDPLVRLLSHSDHGTRVAAAWALRNLYFTTPNAIAKIILKVLDLLQRDTSSLLALEAEETVADILRELHRQREQIVNTRDTVCSFRRFLR